jgi:uncharacterized membrane protein (UPF0127 family)
MRLALLLLLAACASPQPPPPKAQPTVTLSAADGSLVKVDVEVVDTPEGRQRGLMNRASIADNAGMLFLFPREQQLSFWMKNTLIPLDIIFIRADYSVLGIVENAEPMTEQNRFVSGSSQFVLEVVGGWATRHGIISGSRVKFDDVPPIPSL